MAAANYVPKVLEVLREHVRLRSEVSRMHELYCQQRAKYTGLVEVGSSADANRPSAWI